MKNRWLHTVQNSSFFILHYSLLSGVEDFLHGLVDDGQFFDIVDAEAFDGFENGQCDDLFTLRKQHGRGVGDVIFALGVVCFEKIQHAQQVGRIEKIIAHIDFGDSSLTGGCVFFFDDFFKIAVQIANNAAQSVAEL
jgi:hypothetical protein